MPNLELRMGNASRADMLGASLCFESRQLNRKAVLKFPYVKCLPGASKCLPRLLVTFLTCDTAALRLPRPKLIAEGVMFLFHATHLIKRGNSLRKIA